MLSTYLNVRDIIVGQPLQVGQFFFGGHVSQDVDHDEELAS